MMKAGLFIDLSNLYYCVGRRFKDGKIDYEKYLGFVAESLPEGCELAKAKAFGTRIENEAEVFKRRLESIGYSTKFIQTQKNKNISLNVNIVVDILRHINVLDVIVIGSSSKELLPFIGYLEEIGKQVIVVACGICNELRNTSLNSMEIEQELLEDGTTGKS